MSKFNVVDRYNNLNDGSKIFVTLFVVFAVVAGYCIGLSILQYLLASTFNIYYSKVELLIAAMCWGIFEGLSGASLRGK
jgi:hypothetical protein